MKRKVRFGGNILAYEFRFFFIMLCIVLVCSCNFSENNIKNLLTGLKQNSSFIDHRYYKDNPIAQLINIPVYTDKEVLFKLPHKETVQIYAVGELVYNLADVRSDYFFKSDDIELYFKIRKSGKQDTVIAMNFTWLDGKKKEGKIKFQKYKVEFIGDMKVDSITSKYLAQIKIPWTVLHIKHPYIGQKLLFDTQIGDNDDDYKQEAKIGLYGQQDHILYPSSSFGYIELLDKKGNANISKSMKSIKSHVAADSGLLRWENIPKENLRQNIMGIVKDNYDLSAKVQCSWNNEALFLYYEIQDANRKSIDPGTIRKLQTFLDYAWIEDEGGTKVWEMNAIDSKPAGGAVKNRTVDAKITLNKGSYSLHYTSDESHAFDNWDDDAPTTPFYGVVIYHAK